MNWKTIEKDFEESLKNYNVSHKGVGCFHDALKVHAIISFFKERFLEIIGEDEVGADEYDEDFKQQGYNQALQDMRDKVKP